MFDVRYRLASSQGWLPKMAQIALLLVIVRLTDSTAQALDLPGLPPVMTSGHADLAVSFSPLTSKILVRAGAVVDGVAVGTDTYYNPDELLFLTGATRLAPLDNSLSFTGALAGDSVWVFPETDTSGVPFVGISNQSLSAADWVGDLTWRVTAIDKPSNSEFSIWIDGVSGPQVIVSTLDGLPDQFQLPAGGHQHFNFGLSKAGYYGVTFEVSGTHVNTGFQSASGYYMFGTVPEPGTLCLASLAVSLVIISRRGWRR